MLRDIAELPNETEDQKGMLVDFWMRGVIAYDAETEAELHKSNARRRAGRPAHYYVYAPSGRTSIHHLKSGWRRVKIPGKVFGLSAFTDALAIAKANARFPREFARFQQTGYREDTLSDIELQIQAFTTEHIRKRYDPFWTRRKPVEVLACSRGEQGEGHAEGSAGVTWSLRLRYEATLVAAVVRDEEDTLTLVSCEEEAP